MSHPAAYCPSKTICFCINLDPQLTCCLIACCIISNGFICTNFGIHHIALYFLSIGNSLLLIFAGVLLMLGTIWKKNSLKVACCWILFISAFTTIAGCAVYIAVHKKAYAIWDEFSKSYGVIIVICNTSFVVISNFYFPMVIYDDVIEKAWNVCRSPSRFRPRGDRVRVGIPIRFLKSLMDGSEEEEILKLTAEEKWEEILKFDKNRFLPWVWPEKKNLLFIGEAVRKQNSNSIISVGCGSGLLEWLLSAATGVQVKGVEIDGCWWKSKYSTGTFIPVQLVEDSKKGKLEGETRNSVLLFCYFNNLEAFLNYVSKFKGNCFIVIGPGPGRGTYTVPEPFNLPESLHGHWTLSDHQEIRSSKDFIAVYIRT